MGKLILYSAMSADGFIATANGGVDWLYDGGDYGYDDFVSGIGTTLMGHKTYEQILSFGPDFPYKDQVNYVFTRNEKRKDTDDVRFVCSNIPTFVTELKKESVKDIWLVGGGEINTLMLKHRLIDELWLFVQPTFLGQGLPLFANLPEIVDFELKEIKNFSTGMVLKKLEPLL